MLLAYSIGGQLYFHIQRQQIRREVKLSIKKGVPRDQLHTFVFAEQELNELTWHKPHEFQLGVDFYDVVHRFKNHPDSVVFECIKDSQEKLLFKNLDKHLALLFKNPVNRKHQEHLVAGFTMKFLPPTTDPIASIQIEKVRCEPPYNCFALSVHLRSETPPPDWM